MSVCFDCGLCCKSLIIEIDHVIPECEGGSSEPENLQLLCRGCNRRKEILRRFPRVTT